MHVVEEEDCVEIVSVHVVEEDCVEVVLVKVVEDDLTLSAGCVG